MKVRRQSVCRQWKNRGICVIRAGVRVCVRVCVRACVFFWVLIVPIVWTADDLNQTRKRGCHENTRVEEEKEVVSEVGK